jgi:hypothetical protein
MYVLYNDALSRRRLKIKYELQQVREPTWEQAKSKKEEDKEFKMC